MFRLALQLRSLLLVRWRPVPVSGTELRFWLSGLAIVLAAAVLRLLYVADMEYKGDEAWTFIVTQQVRGGGDIPRFGMPTSQNMLNPGGSIWVFIGLDQLFKPDGPTGLARIGQWMNVLAIAGLILFARVCVQTEWRGAWLWAAALAAVNPIAVLMHRKIWPPSIAPLLLLGVLIGWWHRDRRWGAAMWGFLVVAIGQIHLSGIFLGAGLAGWALAFDRRGVRWWAWALGSAVAAWPLALWLPEAIQQAAAHPTGQLRLDNILTLKFYLRWFTEPLGISLQYALGQDFWEFLRYPLIVGRPTYLVAILHGLIAALAGYFWITTTITAWRERANWRRGLIARHSPTLFLMNAVILGYGGLLTLSCVPIPRHYMLVAFPALYLWVAVCSLADRRPLGWGLSRGQALLAAMCLVQFAVSACFLGYVHDARRTIRGDYGTPYALQVREGLPPR